MAFENIALGWIKSLGIDPDHMKQRIEAELDAFRKVLCKFWEKLESIEEADNARHAALLARFDRLELRLGELLPGATIADNDRDQKDLFETVEDGEK